MKVYILQKNNWFLTKWKRLSKEDETQLEISFVDESKNSKQITWSLNMNKPYLLSRLIAQVKLVWEKIFFVELPINF